ncbi:hypothetical protein FQZ97_834660 [compost metagenome]
MEGRRAGAQVHGSSRRRRVRSGPAHRNLYLDQPGHFQPARDASLQPAGGDQDPRRAAGQQGDRPGRRQLQHPVQLRPLRPAPDGGRTGPDAAHHHLQLCPARRKLDAGQGGQTDRIGHPRGDHQQLQQYGAPGTGRALWRDHTLCLHLERRSRERDRCQRPNHPSRRPLPWHSRYHHQPRRQRDPARDQPHGNPGRHHRSAGPGDALCLRRHEPPHIRSDAQGWRQQYRHRLCIRRQRGNGNPQARQLRPGPPIQRTWAIGQPDGIRWQCANRDNCHLQGGWAEGLAVPARLQPGQRQR